MPDFGIMSKIPWTGLVISSVLILSVVSMWIWVEYKADPERGTIDEPDGGAFLKGKCGDAMKISLKFTDDKVEDAKYWTDGCRMSRACGAAAVRLALNKTPEEIADIDYKAVEKEAGGLPEEDVHCATLAAGTLHEALRDYMLKTESSDETKTG